jgi:ferredoxin
MRIVADRGVCVGSGMCVLTAPDVFDQDDIDGRVSLLTQDVAGDRVELANEAVSQCPTGALSVVDAEEGNAEDV